MKRKEGRSITLLLSLMLIFMNLFAVPAWAAPEDVAIDETNFPDANFRTFVSTKDTDSDGFLSQSELDAVTVIDVYGKNITNLKGLELFKNLDTLRCSNNQLTTLDVTKNTALESLDCGNNQLTALDVRNNPELISLNCSNNQLSALNVSKNLELTSLNCSKNQLTYLHMGENEKLEELDCSNNQLTLLSVSASDKVTNLKCDNNQLTELYYSYDQQPTHLDCSNNRLTCLRAREDQMIDDFNGENQEYDIEVNKNTLTFNLDSLPGSFEPEKADNWVGGTVSGGNLKLDTTMPAKVTYTYNSTSRNTLPVTLNVTYKEDTTPVPNPTIDKFTITVDPNGGNWNGNSAVAIYQVDKGKYFTLPIAPTKKGYTFQYWKGSKYQPGDKYLVEGDHTFIAVWKKNEVTPNTGDNGMLYAYALGLLVATSSMLIINARRNTNNQK